MGRGRITLGSYALWRARAQEAAEGAAQPGARPEAATAREVGSLLHTGDEFQSYNRGETGRRWTDLAPWGEGRREGRLRPRHGVGGQTLQRARACERQRSRERELRAWGGVYSCLHVTELAPGADGDGAGGSLTCGAGSCAFFTGPRAERERGGEAASGGERDATKRASSSV